MVLAVSVYSKHHRLSSREAKYGSPPISPLPLCLIFHRVLAPDLHVVFPLPRMYFLLVFAVQLLPIFKIQFEPLPQESPPGSP